MDTHQVTFEAFPKIPRLKSDVTITEKIDGTNAAVIITEDGQIAAQSRSRLLTPGKTTDNFGFAGWVEANKAELLKLGPGRHFGEWWGLGIQCGYNMTERRFSLFNVHRWQPDGANPPPACCDVVPILYQGENLTEGLEDSKIMLDGFGSLAARRTGVKFDKPEGLVVYNHNSRSLSKVIFAGDIPKSLMAPA